MAEFVLTSYVKSCVLKVAERREFLNDILERDGNAWRSRLSKRQERGHNSVAKTRVFHM